MANTHHLFLIPGFFGFANFGRLIYFSHVREFLEDALARQGMRIEVHRCRTSPTASLRTRGRQLFDYVRETVPPGAGPIHLIGHSTGGLDARLFTTPGVSLDTEAPVEPYARRVRSVVSVASPHHGTPLASFFSSLLGQQILKLLSLWTVAILRQGRLPLSLFARTGAALTRARLSGSGSKTGAIFEHLEGELIGQLPEDQRDLVARFVQEITQDQALIAQLAPEAMELFNATSDDRPGVRYGCVVTKAGRPRLRTQLHLGLHPSDQAMYGAYRWLHHQASLFPENRRPALSELHRDTLLHGFGALPTLADNDGIVPTLSQLWGELLYTAEADHLDVVGHFDDPSHQPAHRDWLTTGSDFRRAEFEALWSAVARFIATSAPESPPFPVDVFE